MELIEGDVQGNVPSVMRKESLHEDSPVSSKALLIGSANTVVIEAIAGSLESSEHGDTLKSANSNGGEEEEVLSATGQGPTGLVGGDQLLKLQLEFLRPPLVICGPSGVGKGTVIGKLTKAHPDLFGFSVSHTTRGPRPGEDDGVHYHFTTKEAMEADIANGLFLEHAHVHGNIYGTSLAGVARVAQSGKICILDIDVQGAMQVKKSAVGSQAMYIFIAPPSYEELERRLRGRGTETEDKVLTRLKNAKTELEKSKEPGLFNCVIVNDNLDRAVEELKSRIEELSPGSFPALQAPPSQAGLVTRDDSIADSGVLTPKKHENMGLSELPVRQYMDKTVVPVLRDGLKALNVVRPEDPFQFLAEYLLENKPVGTV